MVSQNTASSVGRVLGVVLGALIIILGIWCVLTPIETFGVVGFIAGVAMVADGIGKAVLWNDMRKQGVSDGWALVGAIVSIVLGVILLGSEFAQVIVDIWVAWIVAIWVIFAGVVRIARSLMLRKVHNALGTRVLGANWGLALAAGVVLVIVGVFCLANPGVMMVALGWQIGLAVILGGASLITATL